MCVWGFILWRRSCVFFLSSCWVWGRLLFEPLLVWLLCLFLGHLRFSAVCPAAGYPSWVPHLAGSGWLASPAVDVYCGVGGVLVHHLVFYLVPALLPLPLLPLSGFCTLSGSSSLVCSCGGALLLGWQCLVTPLGFLPCASAAPPSAAYP